MNRNTLDHGRILAAAFAAMIALIILAGPARAQTAASRAAASMSSPIRISPKPPGPVDLSTAIVKVANQNIPAVVSIEVTESRLVQNPLLPFQNDPFFRRFFGIPKKMPRNFKQQMVGLGSGMILDAAGHILTNSHVAANAQKMTVTLADGSRHTASLIGTDPKTDLAVIKIAAPHSLPYVVFGDSDKLEVGEWVVAIGAPRALEKSVTQGIVSAKHRTGISDPSSYQDFLQTDAPINPGNSGGPLLNLHGQVVGVNAAIATESGGFEGIGFTIPSNMAVHVARTLIARGKVERGWIGVSIRDLTPDVAKTARVTTGKGALVMDVVKGGPADRAGIAKDDVVTAYNGKEVPDSNAFRNDVSETTEGTVVRITLLRNGNQKEVQVRIGGEKDATNAMIGLLKQRLGAELRPPTPAEIERYGLTSGFGVMINSVDPGGPLGRAGFEKADGILAIEGQPASGIDGLAAIVSMLKPGEKASLLALDHRTGNTGTVTVTVR